MFNPQTLFAPQTMQERYDAYATLRQAMPVLHIPDLDLWFVFRYDDVRTIVSLPESFSSDFNVFGGARLALDPDATLSLQSIIGVDPPKHRKLRDLLTRAFTPRTIESYEAKIRKIVDDLIDSVIESGHMDLVGDLAEPLPTRVISDMLGIDPAYQETFRQASELLLGGDLSQAVRAPELAAAEDALNSYLYELIARRRLKPEDDLTSKLIAADVDGEHLTDRDIVGFCELLLIAGNGTTTHLIGNMMLALLQFPDQFVKLRADTSKLPAAIEEALRFYSPALQVLRSAKQDYQIGGQTIPAGARIFPMLASANRDDGKFPNPDTFNIDREANQHIAFGNGIHYCIGAPLGRLETRVAFTAILNRLHNIALAPDSVPTLNPGLLINSLKALSITFTPGARLG